MSARALLVMALSLVACGDDDVALDAAVNDAGARDSGVLDAGGDVVSMDAGAPDAAPADSGSDAPSVDASADAAAEIDAQTDAGFGMSCEAACAETRLEARFGDVTELFDVAYFGVNTDGSLRVEVYGGAAEGCPEMDSPSPDRTLILGLLPEPVDRSELTMTATLLDFEGTLTDAPFLSTPTAIVRPVSASLTPLTMAFIRVDFDASFEGGEVDGAIYATYCSSLDE
ncbi:MAG: hypothetical protein AB8H86_24170 [Polyangiales bacterium]